MALAARIPERERRLRWRIDHLGNENTRLRAQRGHALRDVERLAATIAARDARLRELASLATAAPPPNACCVYCGRPPRPGRGWPVVCGQHADLPALDPVYQAHEPRDTRKAVAA